MMRQRPSARDRALPCIMEVGPRQFSILVRASTAASIASSTR